MIELALLRLSASTMINSSIKLSFTGVQVGWTIHTSRPRTDSLICTLISPSLKCPKIALDKPTFRCLATSLLKLGCALPLKILKLRVFIQTPVK
ncbi:hypothetical protein BN341_15570 [Helicobacter heilmannii ASB1.4]|nr:hypothetical protein BN341_15570 [Helicobacter heilmannii ASB1.4]